MMTNRGYIDALILQPKPTLTASDRELLSYLERRIIYATDEDHKTSIFAILEEFYRIKGPPPDASRMSVPCPADCRKSSNPDRSIPCEMDRIRNHTR